MGSSIALAAVAAALAVQSAAGLAPSEPLKPSLPWNVDFAESMCLLQREFGTGDQAVMLGFQPGLFSEHMRLLLVQKGKEGRLVQGEAKLAFDDGPVLEKPYYETFIPGRDVRVIVIDLNEAELAPLASAKQFRIQAGKQKFTLEPTVVPAAMKVLEACEKDLLVKWGMDLDTVASIATFPKLPGGGASIFKYTDYPQGALRKLERGTAGVRFWVGKDGKVRDCTVVQSSGSALLDRQTCSIITKRALYEPARTATGETVESIAFQRVRWELRRP